MFRLAFVPALAAAACTQHGEPVHEHLPPASAEGAEPVESASIEEAQVFACTRQAYRVLGRWTGVGESERSQAEARTRAEAIACEAAGAEAGCVDSPGFVSSQERSHAQSSFVDGAMTKHFEAEVTVVRVGESAEREAHSKLSPRAACEEARGLACSELGFDSCSEPELFAPRPPGSGGLLGKPAPSEAPVR